LLAFTPLCGHHTGEHLAVNVYDTLHEYNIKQKLNCITTDNASNNIAMVRSLSDHLAKQGIHWNYKTNHIPCLAHIINIVVQKFIKTVIKSHDDDDTGDNDIDVTIQLEPSQDSEFNGMTFNSIIAVIRAIAKSIRSSPLRWESFQKACKSYNMKPMTIPLDITVRWNSTFNMLMHAIYLRRPIRRYIDDLDEDHDTQNLQLTDEQWKQAEVLCLFLLPFKRCSTRFECNSSSTEIDYVFFAYDSMYNHIDDVKAKLTSGTGIGALPCSEFILEAIDKMESVLKKYYTKTQYPTVYADGMILNPRTKLVIFEEESWEDENSEDYSSACRRRFVQNYDRSTRVDDGTVAEGSTSSSDISGTGASSRKRPLASSLVNDTEYHRALLSRSIKRRRNDFDRYIEIPNDPSISSCLDWWRQNHRSFPDLAKMARDVLAVPASGCAVERQFSISGRIAIWQRNRLSPRSISDSIIYKGALAKTRTPLNTVPDMEEDNEYLPVPENEGTVPEEWVNTWWNDKLGKVGAVSGEVRDMFGQGDDVDDDDDIYG
jgi:hypothetical protein